MGRMNVYVRPYFGRTPLAMRTLYILSVIFHRLMYLHTLYLFLAASARRIASTPSAVSTFLAVSTFQAASTLWAVSTHCANSTPGTASTPLQTLPVVAVTGLCQSLPY